MRVPSWFGGLHLLQKVRPFGLDRQTTKEEGAGTYVKRNISSTSKVLVFLFLKVSDAKETEMFQFTGEWKLT
jgi:hypothetical protein